MLGSDNRQQADQCLADAGFYALAACCALRAAHRRSIVDSKLLLETLVAVAALNCFFQLYKEVVAAAAAAVPVRSGWTLTQESCFCAGVI